LLRELPGNRLVAYHNEIPGDARRELIEGIAAAGGRACDVMHLPAVLRDSPTDVATRELAAARGWRVLRVPGNRSPYVPLVGSWDAFLAGKSSNFRYTLKRKAKALAGHGKVSSVRYERTDTVAELLKHINTIEASSWKAAADMAITGSEQEMAYYNELLPWLASIGALAANVSFIGEQPVAYSLCCHWRGRFAQLKTSFDEKFNAGSPGLVVNAEAIKYAFEAGANEFDFLGDVMPHKQHWTAQLREYDHLFVFTNTLKGRALGAAKQIVQRLRPAQVPITTGRSGRRPDRE
jgi:CelD/BcsL family acetyltransferase involved in cellulose biosynthesis